MIANLLVLMFLFDESVVLKAEAKVDANFVRLMHVIEGEALGPIMRGALEEVWLGRAPGVGEERVIRLEEIRQELQRRGIDAGAVSWVGEQVRVVRVDRIVPTADRALKELIQLDLRRRLLVRTSEEEDRIRVRVEYLSVCELPEGTELIGVTPLDPVRLGAVHFTAIALRSGTERMEFEGVARIYRRTQAAFARVDLRAYHVIRHDDIEMRELDLESTEGYCTDLESLVGSRLQENIRRGAVLLPSQVQLKPLIRRGESVLVDAEVVQMEGCAESDGRLGDRIRISFPDSRKSVTARVTSRGHASLKLED